VYLRRFSSLTFFTALPVSLIAVGASKIAAEMLSSVMVFSIQGFGHKARTIGLAVYTLAKVFDLALGFDCV
jgi:hypothetical protein